MIFCSHANKNPFHKKGFALCLVLKVVAFGTRQWPVVRYILPRGNSFSTAMEKRSIKV